MLFKKPRQWVYNPALVPVPSQDKLEGGGVATGRTQA